MKARPHLEICGASDEYGFICDRLLEEGEWCPLHPGVEARTEEYEPDIEWMIDEREVRCENPKAGRILPQMRDRNRD